MFISSFCDTSMRSASFRRSSDEVRVGTRATISTACAWWPIMPCMNLMSAPGYCTCDRSLAGAAAMTRLGCPGAPGWTIGGGAVTPAAERQEPAAAAASRMAAIRYRTRHRIHIYARSKPVGRRGGPRRHAKPPGRGLPGECLPYPADAQLRMDHLRGDADVYDRHFRPRPGGLCRRSVDAERRSAEGRAHGRPALWARDLSRQLRGQQAVVALLFVRSHRRRWPRSWLHRAGRDAGQVVSR